MSYLKSSPRYQARQRHLRNQRIVGAIQGVISLCAITISLVGVAVIVCVALTSATLGGAM
jgi:hypothetical protein